MHTVAVAVVPMCADEITQKRFDIRSPDFTEVNRDPLYNPAWYDVAIYFKSQFCKIAVIVLV